MSPAQVLSQNCILPPDFAKSLCLNSDAFWFVIFRIKYEAKKAALSHFIKFPTQQRIL